MALEVTYIGAIIAGLLSFLSPCVLPLVPPYLCFLGGTTVEQLTTREQLDRATHRRIVMSSLMFVLGFTTVFVALGATATWLGQLVSAHLNYLAYIGGAIIIVLGLHFLGLFKIPLLYRDVRFSGPAKPAGLVSAYLIGLAFAFGWTPCVGPVLGAILAVAAGEDTVWSGVSLLFVYSLGLGIPFVAAAFGARAFMAFLSRFKNHLGKVEKLMGGALVVTGILFITGSMSAFSIWLLETFPALAQIG